MYHINIKNLFGNSKSSSKSKEFMSFDDKKNLFYHFYSNSSEFKSSEREREKMNKLMINGCSNYYLRNNSNLFPPSFSKSFEEKQITPKFKKSISKEFNINQAGNNNNNDSGSNNVSYSISNSNSDEDNDEKDDIDEDSILSFSKKFKHKSNQLLSQGTKGLIQGNKIIKQNNNIKQKKINEKDIKLIDKDKDIKKEENIENLTMPNTEIKIEKMEKIEEKKVILFRTKTFPNKEMKIEKIKEKIEKKDKKEKNKEKKENILNKKRKIHSSSYADNIKEKIKKSFFNSIFNLANEELKRLKKIKPNYFTSNFEKVLPLLNQFNNSKRFKIALTNEVKYIFFTNENIELFYKDKNKTKDKDKNKDKAKNKTKIDELKRRNNNNKEIINKIEELKKNISEKDEENVKKSILILNEIFNISLKDIYLEYINQPNKKKIKIPKFYTIKEEKERQKKEYDKDEQYIKKFISIALNLHK